MRKFLLVLLVVWLALPPVYGAQSEALDLTAQVNIEAESNQQRVARLTDRKLDTAWQGKKGAGTLTLSSSVPMHGLYISWAQEPRAFAVEQHVDGQWTSQSIAADAMVHQYYPLNGVSEVRLVPEQDNGKNFGIQELYVLGDGLLPAWVQTWQPTLEKADLMLLFAHPDDEVLFYGGTLPYYAAHRELKVLPVVYSYASPMRRSELLNCLWSLGIRNYPVLGEFSDRYSSSLDQAYSHNNRRYSQRFMVELIRKHQPDVLVSHDVHGEYGHGMHRLCADIATRGVRLAADPEYHPETYDAFGGHQVQKLYLHLYKEREADVQIEMNWDIPIPSLGGLTGFEAAQQAYQQFHLSQHRYEQFKVEPRDSRHSSYLFGLAHSEVGPDVRKDDFFEHLPQAIAD